jgi:hypothetical protein
MHFRAIALDQLIVPDIKDRPASIRDQEITHPFSLTEGRIGQKSLARRAGLHAHSGKLSFFIHRVRRVSESTGMAIRTSILIKGTYVPPMSCDWSKSCGNLFLPNRDRRAIMVVDKVD